MAMNEQKQRRSQKLSATSSFVHLEISGPWANQSPEDRAFIEELLQLFDRYEEKQRNKETEKP